MYTIPLAMHVLHTMISWYVGYTGQVVVISSKWRICPPDGLTTPDPWSGGSGPPNQDILRMWCRCTPRDGVLSVYLHPTGTTTCRIYGMYSISSTYTMYHGMYVWYT